MTKNKRDPLQPLASAASAMFWLFILLLVAGTLTTIFGSSSLFGLGDNTACADDQGYSTGDIAQEITRPGVTALSTGIRLCTDHPDAAQMTWQALTMIPSFLFTTGALFLTWRLVRRATRDGIYTLEVARGLRFLGWWLLIGGILAPLAEEMADNRLLASLATLNYTLPRFTDISPTIILVGLGILTFARIMRIGVQMQQDLQGTI